MLKQSRNSLLQSFLNYAAIASTKEKNTKQVTYIKPKFFSFLSAHATPKGRLNSKLCNRHDMREYRETYHALKRKEKIGLKLGLGKYRKT